MVQKSKGPRKRTRKLLRVKERTPITKYLQKFEIGERVVIRPTPSSHKGMPFKRFVGKIGTIIEKRGKAYIVQIKNGEKEKKIIARPEHLRLV